MPHEHAWPVKPAGRTAGRPKQVIMCIDTCRNNTASVARITMEDSDAGWFVWPFKWINPVNGLKKRPETEKNKLKSKFSTSFFLNFGPWTLKSSKFERKFGFYIKFPPQNRLEMSRICNPGPKMTKLIF